MSDMSINDFIKSMKAAGFDFTYRATNGTQTFTGEVKASGESNQVAIKTSQQSRMEIKNMFKKASQ